MTVRHTPIRPGHIDLRRVPGFSAAAPPATDWLERDRAAARRADQTAAGLIMLAAAAILAGLLFLPEFTPAQAGAALIAVLRGTF